MGDLTEFLLARIAEDEAWTQWQKGDDPARPGSALRVLVECKAKRRIVAAHRPYDTRRPDELECSSCGDVPQVAYPCETLRILANVYAGHPDFRQEWKL